ncbi:shikimate kinase, partial [Erwinia amylovora]
MSLPIYLIGARGCGKTTLGQALALALGYVFCDTDHFLQHTS